MLKKQQFENIGISLYDNTKKETEKCIANFRKSSECEKICNLLNKQNDEIRELKNQLAIYKIGVALFDSCDDAE